MDRNSYRLIAISLLLVALLFYLLPQSSASAAEISESQIVAIENKLNRLETLKQQSLMELEVLNGQLEVSQQRLNIAKQQLEMLKYQLAELKQTSKKQEESLTKYEEYCKKLEKQKAKKVLNEYSVQVNPQEYISGIGYGKYFLISQYYVGAKAEYDWKDSRFNLWLSCLM